MSNESTDPVMLRVREVFEQSGLSLEELGNRMGYPAETARKSAWQFVRRTNDPRFSMVRKFAEAVGVSLSELVNGA
jgi:transcriptional regulator with XRE-family HTH domain